MIQTRLIDSLAFIGTCADASETVRDRIVGSPNNVPLKRVRTGFAGIVCHKTPDLPYSSVFPVRIICIAMVIPVRGVEKMTPRMLLESTLFPDGKETCRKADG